MLVSVLISLMMLLQASVGWQSSVDSDGRIVLVGEPSGDVTHVSGTVTTIACSGNKCFAPSDWEFDLETEGVGKSATVSVADTGETVAGTPENPSKSLWALILEAVLWGLAMLLTPCVFPMVPMTVSYFIKGSENTSKGRTKAAFYGLFIVLLYTVPISLVIAVTYIAGGGAVTADIFNFLSTHWLPNIIFFLVFMLFAASFFGAFEITLPSRWVNGADGKSDRKGLGGVFFLALTLVLVSFSCTGPIVGTVLIKSTRGEFWTPMVTMLAFSIAFALPFTLLAFFPSLLKKLPRSGGWLNSVKVTLGFVELALGLKFLSTADQVYHWGILPRGLYISIWVVLFAMLGFYYLGKIRFKYDDEVKSVGVGRLALSLVSFVFALYLLSGFWGTPLRALSGYLPPVAVESVKSVADVRADAQLQALSLEEGMERASREGKRLFVDITGYGCVNCREMESRVFSDPAVREKLENGFVVVKLYVDDKTPLPESQWLETESGKILKDVGRVNSYIALKRFNVNSQPNYFILDKDGQIAKGPYAYNLSVQDFLDFLSL